MFLKPVLMKYTNKTGIAVEVAYAATSDQQRIISLVVPKDATIESAIMQSGLLTEFPDIDLKEVKTGIFGCVLPLSHALQAGDRVEIYRPLAVDPKQARVLRAKR